MPTTRANSTRTTDSAAPVADADDRQLAAVLILAAGAGTRMKSTTPKVLHSIAGRSLLGHAIAAGRELNPDRLCVVVRHQRDRVAEHALSFDKQVEIADQDDIPGTGRAVQCALQTLGELHGSVVVTAGDTPLLDATELQALLSAHQAAGNAVTVLSARVDNPFGYGRVIRDAAGAVTGIVEEKDADDAQRQVDEINTATYVFDADVLTRALARVDQNNAQGEVYLTDVIALAHRDGERVGAHILADAATAEGANDRSQLARLGAELNRRTLERWMKAGVTIVDPGSTWIDVDASFGTDVTIEPGCQILGATTVADGVRIGPDTTIKDCEIAAGATLVRTHAELSEIQADATVGPFVHLAPGSVVIAKERVKPFSAVGTSLDDAASPR